MIKLRGFTLVEILTTMTILGIVASIAAPEYWRMRDRDEYLGEGQSFFDTILDGRNAALTNKLCKDGNTAVRWMFIVTPNTSPIAYELRCYTDATTYTTEQESVALNRSELETLLFNGAAPVATAELIEVSFFTGGVNARLEYQHGGGTQQKVDAMRIVLGHANTDYEQAICFNRISGFPTYNKTGNTCQDY